MDPRYQIYTSSPAKNKKSRRQVLSASPSLVVTPPSSHSTPISTVMPLLNLPSSSASMSAAGNSLAATQPVKQVSDGRVSKRKHKADTYASNEECSIAPQVKSNACYKDGPELVKHPTSQYIGPALNVKPLPLPKVHSVSSPPPKETEANLYHPDFPASNEAKNRDESSVKTIVTSVKTLSLRFKILTAITIGFVLIGGVLIATGFAAVLGIGFAYVGLGLAMMGGVSAILAASSQKYAATFATSPITSSVYARLNEGFNSTERQELASPVSGLTPPPQGPEQSKRLERQLPIVSETGGSPATNSRTLSSKHR